MWWWNSSHPEGEPATTPAAFQAALLRDGYTADTRDHTHPFDVRGLVLEGEFTVTTAEGSRTDRAGEVFALEAGRPHSETIGPKGARNMVGRLHPAGG